MGQTDDCASGGTQRAGGGEGERAAGSEAGAGIGRRGSGGGEAEQPGEAAIEQAGASVLSHAAAIWRNKNLRQVHDQPNARGRPPAQLSRPQRRGALHCASLDTVGDAQIAQQGLCFVVSADSEPAVAVRRPDFRRRAHPQLPPLPYHQALPALDRLAPLPL